MTASAYADNVRPGLGEAAGLPRQARPHLAAVCVAAVAAAATTALAAPGSVRWADFAVVLVGGAAAQLFASYTAGNQVFHTGLAFTVAAALLLPPELVVVVAVGQHLPEWIRQRYPWYIQSFNIANIVLSGLAAWSVRTGLGYHVSAAPTVSAVLVAAAAAGAFLLVNHALLAEMLRRARGHDVKATGLFAGESLIADSALAAIGIAFAFALLDGPALAVVLVVPLVLIQRALALPTLREQAFRDHKTGLLNSRGIDQPARSEFARSRRLGRQFSVLLCDIDDLRGINNRHGHLEGDAALGMLARAFRTELRGYDLCARFGGDEFLVVLPETGREEAIAVAERIQAWLSGNPLATTDGAVDVSVSIGAVESAESDERLGDVISRADVAMYEAKRAGRSSFLAVG